MADNIDVTPGSGKTVRTDDVGGVQTQVIKVALGLDGAEDLLLDSGQQTMANSLPVAIASNQSSLPVTPAATESHLGEVGNGAASVTATLTVTNGAYAISDVVGGLITFANAVRANGKHAIINSVKLSGVVAIPYELWFFNADIATPAADNAAFALAAADGLIFLGAVPIAAGDYNAAQTAFNNASLRGVGMQVKAAAATTSIYAYLKATAVTSPGTTTLYLTVDFEWID